MFHRRATQKPTDELYKNFKANFPGLNHDVNGTSAATAGASLADALDMPVGARHHGHHHELKDVDPTTQGSHEHWSNFVTSGLTPAMMDPTSHDFHMFANQLPGYYTPTPGGTSTLNHTMAGDLHTPGFQMGIATPLSASESSMHAGHQGATLPGFHPHLPHVHSNPFQNMNPFQMHQQTSFPPHHFTNQPSFEHMEGAIDGSPVEGMGLDVNMHHQTRSPQMLFHSHALQKTMQPPPVYASGENFRFHVTLNAQTAMVEQSDDIPVTYLNKGQAYTLNILDTHQPKQTTHPIWYRTFVRVSFETDEQRQRPAACWQLWKEGRGSNEAHQRGGLLQAVEYVESGQGGGPEDPSKPKVEVLSSSFDGFCVKWCPPIGAGECPISVRFNFLSTDFSHSKGVKGIPVRLCAKTELMDEIPNSSPSTGPEVCFCKVKLFRDHGAERKISNDSAHVKKLMEKIKKQISEIESGVRESGKRKRSGSMAKATGLDNRPSKIAKHRRTWSMGSVTSNSGRGSAEEDLHIKLQSHADMLKSARPISVLNLRGDEEDDPDLFPVKISLEIVELLRNDSTESAAWEATSSQNEPLSSSVSPVPSTKSLSATRTDSKMQQPTPIPGASRMNSNEWPTQPQPQTATVDLEATPPANPQHLASPPDNVPTKMRTRSPNSGAPSGWIEARDVDPLYQPPAERAVTPVACFYIQSRVPGRATSDSFHRAIYLFRRSLKDFVSAAATKSDVEPTQVLRTIRVNHKGLQILFDDDCVKELPEGQDMVAEFREIEAASSGKRKREWNANPAEIQCDGDLTTVQNIDSTGYELRLIF